MLLSTHWLGSCHTTTHEELDPIMSMVSLLLFDNWAAELDGLSKTYWSFFIFSIRKEMV